VTLAVAVMFVAIACESGSETSEGAGGQAPPPAEQTARGFLKAVQYGDFERAWKLHVASTRQGAYCRSESFADVLARTREEMTEADCEGARGLDPTRRANLADDAQLLVQILRFACEHPDGECLDYQREVFTSQMPNSTLAGALDAFEVGEVRVDGATATVYVDYWSGERENADVHHQSLQLERVGGTWVVTTTFD